MTQDEVLTTLEDLLLSLERVEGRFRAVRDRAGFLRGERARGHDYLTIAQREERPLIVELLTEAISELHDASGRFRRAEARALHREGVTMDRIAEVFGVTRQRISSLLRSQETDPRTPE